MQHTQGFTLVELLIVIAIIGILAAVLVPNLVAARGKANDTATMAYVRNCYVAVEAARNLVTGALAGVGTNCNAQTHPNLPTPASSTTGTISHNGTTLFWVAAASVTGKIFWFDGAQMREVTAAAPLPAPVSP